MSEGRAVPEDYFEQFSAHDWDEALPKVQAAAERAKENGMTFPQVTVFDDHRCEFGALYTFQAWKERPSWPDYAAPAHPMLVAKS